MTDRGASPIWRRWSIASDPSGAFKAPDQGPNPFESEGQRREAGSGRPHASSQRAGNQGSGAETWPPIGTDSKPTRQNVVKPNERLCSVCPLLRDTRDHGQTYKRTTLGRRVSPRRRTGRARRSPPGCRLSGCRDALRISTDRHPTTAGPRWSSLTQIQDGPRDPCIDPDIRISGVPCPVVPTPQGLGRAGTMRQRDPHGRVPGRYVPCHPVTDPRRS
jgi:hypothetical protein